MPFEVMDPRGVSASSPLFDDICFPAERQVGFWKPKIMSDHHAEGDGVARIPGSKSVTSSPLEKLLPVGSKSVDYSEGPESYLARDQKEKLQVNREEGTANLSRTPWRTVDHNSKTWSNLYVQPASSYVEVKKTSINGALYESSLFSSSLSEIFNRKLRVSTSDVLSHQSAGTVAPHSEEEKLFKSLEEIEVQTLGNLLPDEDELFSGVVDDMGYNAHANNGDDFEDFDLFSSGGGMELEGDDHLCISQRHSDFNGGIPNSQGGSNGPLASEHPYGEHPSRTLFVRNINSNVEDSELRDLFEQYGDIRTLYTACKHRGFVMISYYDIRAARNAMRALQNKPLRRRKLDIHYSIPKDNPSEKDINQGTLVVFNLDSSVSNDDLRQIFGIYGEIKEIRETPHKRHHKFIEFFDVRAAEAALRALNRSDIAGKRIKLEPSRPGGSRRCLMQLCSSELEQDESILCQSPDDNLSSGCMAAVSPGIKTSSCMDNVSIQDLHSAVRMPIGSFVENATSHGSSSVPNTLPSPMRVVSISNEFGLGETSNRLDQMKFGNQSFPNYHPHSLPEYHDNLANAIRYNSSSTIGDMTGHVGPRITEGIDNRHIHRVGSNGHPIELNGGAFGSSGNGSCPVHGLHRAWGNSSSYQHHSSSPMIWPNSPSFSNGVHAQRPTQVPGFPRPPPHMLNIVSPVHHHHVGSAPAVNPSLWDRRHAYSGESPETSGFHLGSLGSVGFPGSSPLHPLEMASHIFPHVGGNCMDISANVGLRSPQQICHVFPGRNPMLSIPSSFDLPMERVRNLSHRRTEANSNHTDKKQYELDIDRILRGEDCRTTLMIKNIPNKYTSKMLLAAIDEHHRGTYDFIYLPIDFKNKCNVGYAFVNMIDPLHIVPFHQAFNGKKWEKFNSEKVASLAYARIQGKTALIAHFQNSSLMNEDKRCRPILFHTDGPNAGDQEPFPMGSNIRSRPGKARTSGGEESQHQGSPTTSANGEESSNGAVTLLGSAKDSD
ncbi:hypothetical protein AAG906_013844 [Vitis piasezkii]